MKFVKSVFIIIARLLLQTVWGQEEECDNLRIIGGHKVYIEDVPYIVSITEDGEGFCGGSIIHDQFILTAAHCIDTNSTSTLKVLVGSDRLTSGGILIEVEEKLCHEEYDFEELTNDICLLKLAQPVPFGCKVAKISLPDEDFDIDDGTMVNVTGWGNTKIYGYDYPNDLRQVMIPIVSDICCRKIYDNYNDTMLCAGSRGHDSCQGDSGGPLTYYNTQIGVVSFGNGCAIMAGVYTKVSMYLDWINSTITDNLLYSYGP